MEKSEDPPRVQVMVGVCPQEDPNYFYTQWDCPDCQFHNSTQWNIVPPPRGQSILLQHGDSILKPCAACGRLYRLRCFGTFVDEYGEMPKDFPSLTEEVWSTFQSPLWERIAEILEADYHAATATNGPS